MRFIQNGPNLPDDLLEERDAGNVVFFCGAGISSPALPGFLGLAEQVIAEFKPPPGSGSLLLLNRIKSDPALSPPLDQVFNLLQQDYGPVAVEEKVNAILRRKSATASIEQHSIVLRLSQGATRKPQIVTTNFDRLFERAQRRIPRHVLPVLPDLTSGQPLEGLVYLHGRLPPHSVDGTSRLGFVLSSADFGRAYLADGWATKFVRDLLQNYVIVLLGYSATDPPVRYLLEGLHARADKRPAVIYAFDNGAEDEVEARWRGRGVRPLAYDNLNGTHSALWDSLGAWANRADDPDAWRRTIVALAQTKPQDLQAHERGQVASLVKSDRGAKLFAETAPPPPADWLCVFDRYLRYGNPRNMPGAEGEITPLGEFSLDDDPSRPAGKPWRDGEIGDHLLISAARPGALARLGGFRGSQAASLPDRLFSFVRWIMQVLDEPAAAWWAAGQGSLHDTLSSQIEWQLNRPNEDIDERARKIWSLLLESFRHSLNEDRWFDFARILNRDGWTSSTLRAFERITTPYLECTRPFQTKQLPPEGDWKELRLREVVTFEVKFPPEYAENFQVTPEALPSVVRTLCRGLEVASGLLGDIETTYWQTATFHTEQKPGQHHHTEADRYLRRVVSFFDTLATEQPQLARAEFALWPRSDEFFFDKLRIYVLMKPHLFTGHECAEGIVALSDSGFWNRHHRRELLHTLRARWNDFSDEDRRLIEARILQGPSQWDQEETDEYARRKAIASATLLGWLKQQNCELSAAAEQQLPKLREADDRWRPSWDASADDSGDSFGGNVRIDTDASKIIDAPLAEIIPLAEEHTKHPFFELTEYRPFDGLVKARPFRALSALSLEARKNGRHPIPFWRGALTDWPNDTSDRLRCLFAARLVRLPNDVFAELKHYIPQWFRTNFSKLASAQHNRHWLIWDALIDRLFDLGPEACVSGLGDVSVGGKPLQRSRRTRNHSINSPVGKLAETLFDVLNDLRLPQGQGIPAEIRTRLERLFDAPGEGGDYAICETTTRLRWLFYLDPKWVTGRIIPFFDVNHPRSEPAWNGYLHDDRLPVPELFALLKPHFLKAFPYSTAWAWDDAPIHRLNEFLVVACYWNLKGHRYISYAEARLALQQATEEGREHAIWFLGNVVRDLDEWKKFGKPFVEKAWPRERKFQTTTSSRNFAHLAEEAGDHFPDVVKTILPLLGPVDQVDMLIYRGQRSDEDKDAALANRFPDAMLSLLDRVVPDGSPIPPHDLRVIIDMIVAAEPTLRQDQRWRRLDGIAG